MILKKSVNYAGQIYLAGENVKGKLPADMIAILKEKGAFKVESDNEAGSTEGSTVVLTPAEFSKLNASEEKAHLEKLGIEAGANGDVRLQQYTEWYDAQVKGDEV